MPRVQKRVTISGLVQGVYFRHAARQQAQALRLTGWVRNRHDGRVEAVLQGTPEAVEAMVSWCHDGPPEARIRAVEVEDEPLDPTLQAFTIEQSRYTSDE